MLLRRKSCQLAMLLACSGLACSSTHAQSEQVGLDAGTDVSVDAVSFDATLEDAGAADVSVVDAMLATDAMADSIHDASPVLSVSGSTSVLPAAPVAIKGSAKRAGNADSDQHAQQRTDALLEAMASLTSSLSSPNTPVIARGASRTWSVLFCLLGISIFVAAYVLSRRLTPGRGSRLLSVLRSWAIALLLLAGLVWFWPRANAPSMLLFLVVSLALLLGFRDVLRDVVAWAFLFAEGRVRPGARIEGQSFSGRVDRVGFRATWLRLSSGKQTAIPNRVLLRESVSTSAQQAHTFRIGWRHHPGVTMDMLHDAALRCPYARAGQRPVVRIDGERESHWVVTLDLLDFPDAAALAEANIFRQLSGAGNVGLEAPDGDKTSSDDGE